MDQTAYFNQMREKRKKEILTAARKMLLKDGTSSFTMQKLAKKLDISTVTLYKYFKNMDDVLSAIKDEIIPYTVALTLKENEKIADTSDSSDGISALEQFLLLFHSFLNEIVKHKEDLTLLLLIETYMQDSPSSGKQSDAIALCTEALNHQAEQLLLQAQENGELRKEIVVSHSLPFVHRLVLSTLQHVGLLSTREFRNQQTDLQDYIDEVIHMLRMYLSDTSDKQI